MPALTAPVGKGQINRHLDVRLVQQLLNRFRPIPSALLRVDAMAGHATISAIQEFQRRNLHMHNPDGVVSPNGPTFTALCGGRVNVFKVAWGAKVDAAFRQRVISISDSLSVPVDFLMSAMAFESAETFSPSVENAAGSGAVGLIQFMPSTAKALGTSVDRLVAMTSLQQLDYVEKYFSPRRGRLHTIEDVYMAILYPAAIGAAASATLFSAGSVAYRENKGLDANRDGRITVQEAAAKVRAEYQKGLQPCFLG